MHKRAFFQLSVILYYPPDAASNERRIDKCSLLMQQKYICADSILNHILSRLV